MTPIHIQENTDYYSFADGSFKEKLVCVFEDRGDWPVGYEAGHVGGCPLIRLSVASATWKLVAQIHSEECAEMDDVEGRYELVNENGFTEAIKTAYESLLGVDVRIESHSMNTVFEIYAERLTNQ